MKAKERKAKERKAKEYSSNIPTICYNDEGIRRAFEDGWDAALDYFSSLPFDKMMERFDEYFKEKEENK